MNDSPLPFALRELRAHFAQRSTQVGIVGAGLLLGLSGPFNTLNLLPAVPRILYWLCVVALTYALGSFVTALCTRALSSHPRWLQLLCATLATGFAVGLALAALNLAFFSLWFDDIAAVSTFFAITTAISGVVVIGAAIIDTPKPATARLLDRLPIDKRGTLIALSVTDHYVAVTTTKGTELLLMRLSDAIAETAPVQGLQIHRSHWVATDAIARVIRNGDRATLTLTNGETRPVSRSNITALRDAGLLPR